MKSPNGYGTVFKVKDRPLRKPWKAMVTVGWELRDDKVIQKKKCIGYYSTKEEGLMALADYHRNGCDDNSTVKEVYDAWYKENQDRWSESTERTYASAYTHLRGIEHKPLKTLRVGDLERILDGCGESIRKIVRVVMQGIYSYAMRHEIVQKDYSSLIKTYHTTEEKKEKKPFTAEEIQTLWKDGSDIANSVLVAIYSGWRWNELMSFTIEDDCMVGGSKTKAGKNRIVPIHHKIVPIIDKMYRTPSYDNFRREFDQLMDKYRMSHTPHETRHTTATLLYGQDEHLVKLILGHAEKDITRGTYTHNTIMQLRAVIESIKV